MGWSSLAGRIMSGDWVVEPSGRHLGHVGDAFPTVGCDDCRPSLRPKAARPWGGPAGSTGIGPLDGFLP